MGVHRHQQRPEALDPELPQALRVQVVQIDIGDLLDPGRFQREGVSGPLLGQWAPLRRSVVADCLLLL